MSILVIDDEAGLRRSLCAYLEDLDHEVLEAANGREGLDVLEQNLHSIKAVIVDLNMPVMDGYAFIQEAVARSRELPIIVLSGVGIVEDALRAVRLGAWDFITKPLHNFEILDYTLDKVMEKAGLLRENRLYQTSLEQLVRQRTLALAASEERYRTIIEHMTDAFIRTNALGQIDMVSPSGVELFGCDSEDELLGQPIKNCWMHPERHGAYFALLQERKVLHDFELVLRRKDGSPVPVSTSSRLNTDEAGNALGVEGTFRDITERKRTEEQLVQMKDMSEAANRAKSEFLANMSHELRTPLNGVLGMLQLLKEDGPLEEHATYADMAYTAGCRLLTLLNDILDFINIEARQLIICHEPFSPHDVLEDVLASLLLAAEEKHLELSLRTDPNLPRKLGGDAARLRQMLFNLVGNAIKFTATGSVQMEAWARPFAQNPNKARIYICITDTGIGIPKEKLGHVFERFTQTDGSMARRHDGAGLGLAIVKSIVERMGGDLCVDTEEGAGTAICLHLPLDLILEAAG